MSGCNFVDIVFDDGNVYKGGFFFCYLIIKVMILL